MRILVAARDDTLADFLRNAGHETKTLYVNDMAVQLAREFRADTMVYQTAVNATISHDDAIQALQAAGFRVVLITEPSDSLIHYAAALGVADILTFPVNPAEVLHRMQNPAAAGEAAELVRGRMPVDVKQEQNTEPKAGMFGFLGKMLTKNDRRVKENNKEDIENSAIRSKDRFAEKEKLSLTPEKPSVRQMQIYTNQPAPTLLPKKYKTTSYISKADTAVIYSPPGNTRDAETAKEAIVNPVCLVLENNSLSAPEVIQLALKGVAIVYDDSGTEIFVEHIQKNRAAGREDQAPHHNKDMFFNVTSGSSAGLIKDVAKSGEKIPNLFVTYSPSTGVGKTFIAVNSAVWLASKGVKTALVDLDVDKADLWHTTHMDALVGSPQTTVSTWTGSDSALARHPDLPMFVLPGTTVNGRMPGEEDVKDILKSLAGRYDVVITDLNNTIRLSHIAGALKLANKIFLLSDLSEKCVIQTSMILSHAVKIADIDRMSLVVNRIRQKQLYKPKDIASMFGFSGFSGIPEDVKLLNYCLKKKKYPVLTKSAVGESLRKLFSKELEGFYQPDSKKSLFSVFKRGEI